MSRISQMLTEAGGQLARPTKFNVLIDAPERLGNALIPQNLDTLCKNITIPTITMEPIEIVIKGQKIPVPGRVNQEKTVEMTFILDEYHVLWEMFNNWIIGLDNRNMTPKNDQSSGLLNSLANRGNIALKTRDYLESASDSPMVYIFQGVFPTSVTGPAFNSEGANEIQEFTVSFAYHRYWTNNMTSTGEHDDLDEFLDAVGATAQGSGTFSSLYRNTLGSIGGIYQGGKNILGAVGDISSIF